jgi:hypothetical protein
MITVLIWKKACINLFITYFNIELKRTKLTSHTDFSYFLICFALAAPVNSLGSWDKGVYADNTCYC